MLDASPNTFGRTRSSSFLLPLTVTTGQRFPKYTALSPAENQQRCRAEPPGRLGGDAAGHWGEARLGVTSPSCAATTGGLPRAGSAAVTPRRLDTTVTLYKSHGHSTGGPRPSLPLGSMSAAPAGALGPAAEGAVEPARLRTRPVESRWSPRTTQGYPAAGESELAPSATTWVHLEGTVPREISQAEKEIPRDRTYMWNLRNKTREQAKQPQAQARRELTGGWLQGGGGARRLARRGRDEDA